MKFLVIYFSTIIFYVTGYAQIADTIRVFNHLKLFDRWQLKITNKNYFALLSNNLFIKDETIIKGIYKTDDSTIRFICDTLKLTNKTLLKGKFSNIPFIVQGASFKKQNNYFIPVNIDYKNKDTLHTPKGLYARYYRGDGFGSNIIELKNDMTYAIEDHSCMTDFQEEGTWSINNNQISFIPKDKENSTLDWFTQDGKMFITDEYLIGKKIAKSYTKTKRIVITENYYYLAKQLNYLKK